MSGRHVFKTKNSNSLLFICLLLMEASFAEKTNRAEKTYNSNSIASNSSKACNHSTMPTGTAVTSTNPEEHSKEQITTPMQNTYPLVFTITITCHALISLLGIIGNALVFYVLGYLKKKRNTEDIFVLSLATADIVPSLLVAANIMVIFMKEKCDRKCVQSLQTISTGIYRIAACASAWFLVFISFNRYR